jgi:hypothetical protein
MMTDSPDGTTQCLPEAVRIYQDIVYARRGVRPEDVEDVYLCVELAKLQVQLDASPERVTAVRNELSARLQIAHNKIESLRHALGKTRRLLQAIDEHLLMSGWGTSRTRLDDVSTQIKNLIQETNV